MYSVNAGLLLKFDWNYANQTKDSKGLTISFNKEIIKTFTLFTIKGFAYCCHFPKLSYPALHCVLMLKNKLIPFQRFKWSVHFYPFWLSRSGTAKKSTEELLNTLYLFLSLKKIYNFMLTNPRNFYPFKQPLSKHLDYRPLRVPPYILCR